jgi:hypothetical protein
LKNVLNLSLTQTTAQFTKRLGLNEAGISVFEDNDSKEQQAATTTQGIYEDACLL